MGAYPPLPSCEGLLLSLRLLLGKMLLLNLLLLLAAGETTRASLAAGMMCKDTGNCEAALQKMCTGIAVEARMLTNEIVRLHCQKKGYRSCTGNEKDARGCFFIASTNKHMASQGK